MQFDSKSEGISSYIYLLSNQWMSWWYEEVVYSFMRKATWFLLVYNTRKEPGIFVPFDGITKEMKA